MQDCSLLKTFVYKERVALEYLNICQSDSLVYLFNEHSKGSSPGLPEATHYNKCPLQ